MIPLPTLPAALSERLHRIADAWEARFARQPVWFGYTMTAILGLALA